MKIVSVTNEQGSWDWEASPWLMLYESKTENTHSDTQKLWLSGWKSGRVQKSFSKLKALVYDILSQTTATTDYTMWP